MPPIALSTRYFVMIRVAAMVISQLTLTVYIPSLPQIANDLNISEKASQFTYFICLFAFGFSQIFYGPLSDLFGRRPLMLIGLLILFSGNFMAIFATNYPLLLVSRFLQGCGGGAALVLTRASISDVFQKEELIKAFNLLTIALSLTPIFSPFLGGYLQKWVGWHSIFLILSIIVAGILILAFYFFSETIIQRSHIKTENTKILKNYKYLATHPQYLSFSLIIICGYSLCALTLSMAPFIFQKGFSLSPNQFGNIMMIPGLGAILGAFIANRYTKIPLVLIGIINFFLASLIILFSNFFDISSISTTIFSMFIILLAWGLFSAKGFVFALRPFPKMIGIAAGFLSFVQMIGASVISASTSFFNGPSLPLLGYSALFIGFIMFGIRIWIIKIARKPIDNLDNDTFVNK